MKLDQCIGPCQWTALQAAAMRSSNLHVSRETFNGKRGHDGFCISPVMVAWACEAAAEKEREQEGIGIPGLSTLDTYRLDWLISYSSGIRDILIYNNCWGI